MGIEKYWKMRRCLKTSKLPLNVKMQKRRAKLYYSIIPKKISVCYTTLFCCLPIFKIIIVFPQEHTLTKNLSKHLENKQLRKFY